MDIKEIAKRAKVSVATVSRTINKVPTVDPKLAQRVRSVIDELGYYPNTQARALVSGRSRIFGLVVSDIRNPFFPEIVQVFEDIASQHQYEILLTSTGYDPRRMEIAVRRMIERRVDGVAVMTFGMEDALLEDLRLRKVPLVLVDVGPHLPGVSTIHVNYRTGIVQAVDHVLSLGHLCLAFICGPLNLRSAEARRLAFVQATAAHGLPGMVAVGNHTAEGGVRALDQLLEAADPPTAILCSNDMTAIGVLHRAYERGLRVPEDLSLVGFDDIALAQLVVPPLTTVRMSQAELARLAFEALLATVEGADPAASHEYALGTSLIVRASTGRVPIR